MEKNLRIVLLLFISVSNVLDNLCGSGAQRKYHIRVNLLVLCFKFLFLIVIYTSSSGPVVVFSSPLPNLLLSFEYIEGLLSEFEIGHHKILFFSSFIVTVKICVCILIKRFHYVYFRLIYQFDW